MGKPQAIVDALLGPDYDPEDISSMLPTRDQVIEHAVWEALGEFRFAASMGVETAQQAYDLAQEVISDATAKYHIEDEDDLGYLKDTIMDEARSYGKERDWEFVW